MFCQSCGERLDEGVRFCQKCGAKVGDIVSSQMVETPVQQMNAVSSSNIASESPKPQKSIFNPSSWSWGSILIAVIICFGIGYLCGLFGIFFPGGILGWVVSFAIYYPIMLVIESIRRSINKNKQQ